MHLLASLTSPYARKLRAVAAELALDLPVVPTAPMDNPPALVAANPLRKVPALILGDGTSLIDSPVIAGYLLAQVPGQTLMPSHGMAHWRMRSFEALTDGILDAAVGLVFGRAAQLDAATVPSLQRATVAIDLAVKALAAAHAGVGHDSFGYHDICTVVALDYLDFRHPGIDWRAQPGLVALHGRYADRPSLVATRPPTG